MKKKAMSVPIIVVILLMIAGTSIAEDKVVVIPLGAGNALQESSWSSSGIVYHGSFSESGDYPSNIQYKKIGNIVHLRGSANGGGAGNNIKEQQTIATLPQGYRPSRNLTLICATWGWPSTMLFDGYIGTAGIWISSDGVIFVKTVHEYNDELQYLMFHSISFPID